MSEVLTAIFEGGAFVPEQSTHFQPGERVRLVVESIARDQRLAVDEFDQLAEALSVDSGGSRMTRDELHERR